MAGEQAIHNSQWSPCCAWRLAVFPCSLGLLRAASPTGRALRAPPATTTSTIRNGRPASSHRAVFGGPVFRLCGLRFALCPRGFSRFAASDESRTPLLIGLTTACFAHCARPSCAPLAAPPLSPSLGSSYRPALRWPGIPGLRTPFGRVLAPPPLRGFDGYGLFRALRAAKLRPTARALRAPLWSIPPSRLRRATVPQFAMVVLLRLAACSTPLLIGLTTACFRHRRRPSCAPLHKGGSGVVLLTAIVPLTKRLPLIPRGAVGVSRLRGFASDQSIIRSSTSISSTSGLRSALPRAS